MYDMNFENSDPERMGFSRLYVEYRLRFVRFANSYVHDWAVSEDIVTDALLQYWENRAELPSDSNIPAYILTIVRNRCLNHLRHVVVRDTYSHDMKEYYEWDLNTRISTLEACDPSDIYTDEVRSLVDAALAKMPRATREIFSLSRVEGKTFREIAELRGLSVKAVEYHISKALKVMHKELKDYFPFFLLFI